MDEILKISMQLHSEGKLAQAENYLKRILAIHPTHAEALHLLGIIAYQVGKIKLSIELIKQAIKSNPNAALFHSNLAEMYRKLNEIDLSIQHGQQAVLLDPNLAMAWSNLGITYYDAKQYIQAENCHQRALAIHPQLNCSLNNMGSICKSMGQTKQAREFYQAAIAASPNSFESLNNLGALFLEQQEFSLAFDYLRQAIILAPNFSDAHCNIGFVLLNLEKYDNALFHFATALQLKSNYAEAYYGMAKIYLQQQNFIEADYFIHKAIKCGANKLEFYQLLANIYHEQGKSKAALQYLDQALFIDSSDSNSCLSKGRILMEIGETAQAEEHFLKVLSDPSIDIRILAHYCLVQLRKIKFNHTSLNDLLAIMNHSIQAISPHKLEYVYFALGKCHDDLGQWAKAFEYFSLGCHLKRQRISYDFALQRQFVQQLIKHTTPQTIEYLRAFANPSALPIFIVGMPRSGSTLVEQILSSHPAVHGAGELKYFNNLLQQIMPRYPEDIKQLLPENYQAITTKYLSYLQHFSLDASRITDKMPHNFMAIGLIHALFPHAKIIHVQRNPIDTCLSCYTKLFTEGQAYSYDLTELGHYYRDYECIMDHWRHVLPANSWLDITYETIVNDLEEEAKRLVEYCDLSWDSRCLQFHQSKRQIRTASFAQVREPAYTSSIARWRRYENELMPLIEVLNVSNSKYDQKQALL
jgi:tetratricopeptide (TPR) repeat protein